ncbi:MAG: UTP--glucose-1-phosphate uridylyltransferase [Planctomycetota bacterium]
MKDLTEAHLEFLGRYGFDAKLFANWRKGVAEGWYSRKNNRVKGDLLAPEVGSILDLPRRDTPERQELTQLGKDCIAGGELGVVILNGGMATRFGGEIKGTVKVLGSRSFLGLKLDDICLAQERAGKRIPVYLMNSFATAEGTKEHLEANNYFDLDPDRVVLFNQYASARMLKDGDLMLDDDGNISPYGTGHGDFPSAFRHSGCLERFLAGGGRYLLVSNVDNLGARVSPLILGHHIQHRTDITVEVAPKWPGDAGGSPYLVDGRLQLVEQHRYPKKFDPDIVDVFNTNTFWFTAESLDRDFDLGWYYVRKNIDDKKAVQMERLVGELTKFLSTTFLKVKRTGEQNRFLPVKTPEDLEAAREEIGGLYASEGG